MQIFATHVLLPFMAAAHYKTSLYACHPSHQPLHLWFIDFTIYHMSRWERSSLHLNHSANMQLIYRLLKKILSGRFFFHSSYDFTSLLLYGCRHGPSSLPLAASGQLQFGLINSGRMCRAPLMSSRPQFRFNGAKLCCPSPNAHKLLPPSN